MNPKTTDEEFIALWNESESIIDAALRIGTDHRAVTKRRRRIESRLGIVLPSLGGPDLRTPLQTEKLYLDGWHVVFSDCHFWPDQLTPAFLILLQVIADIKPVATHLNGDAFDGAMNSRHSRIGWDQRPTVAQELLACQQFLYQVEYASKGARLFWQRGNHDLRFDTKLASHVSMYEGVPGMGLQDHFPRWTFCNGTIVNNSLMIKHSLSGGHGAARNNAMKAGISIITGHTHRLGITPFSDYNGTRFGIECGTISDPYGPTYDYVCANPLDWQEGFVVVEANGEEITPHTVHVINGKAVFNGKEYIA